MAVYTVVLEWDPESEVWVSFVPQLGNISTYGDTEKVALDATREMIIGYLEALKKAPLDESARPRTKVVELELAMG